MSKNAKLSKGAQVIILSVVAFFNLEDICRRIVNHLDYFDEGNVVKLVSLITAISGTESSFYCSFSVYSQRINSSVHI
jgi:hypothetical protein